jgi:hypothetical protein
LKKLYRFSFKQNQTLNSANACGNYISTDGSDIPKQFKTQNSCIQDNIKKKNNTQIISPMDTTISDEGMNMHPIHDNRGFVQNFQFNNNHINSDLNFFQNNLTNS